MLVARRCSLGSLTCIGRIIILCDFVHQICLKLSRSGLSVFD